MLPNGDVQPIPPSERKKPVSALQSLTEGSDSEPGDSQSGKWRLGVNVVEGVDAFAKAGRYSVKMHFRHSTGSGVASE